jgi:hypothetical protein
MITLLKDGLIHTERQGLVDVSAERTMKTFIGKRISGMETCTLHYLGGLGVPVLNIGNRHSLDSNRNGWGKSLICPSLVRKDFQIVSRTSGRTISHFGEYYSGSPL